jgi:ATP adenylyltransferase
MKVDHLWAPWRLEYVKGLDREKSCPFCSIQQQGVCEESLILAQEPEFFVVMNRFPYNPAHLMIIPNAHLADARDISPQLWMLMAAAQQLCVELLREDSQPAAFNLGLNMGAAAGAGIAQHLHWHVLPRWAGDTNFMPLIAETKALPTHNLTVYRRLRPLFDSFGDRLKAALNSRP